MHRRLSRTQLLAALLVAAAVACTPGRGTAGSTASPGTPSATPSASAVAGLSAVDARLLLIKTFGAPWYCDPDLYPIARPGYDEEATAIQRFPEMQAEGLVYGAVLRSLGLAAGSTFTDAEKLRIYQLWKQAMAVQLLAAPDGRYHFDYAAAPVGGASSGVRTTGTIDPASGAISIASTGTADPPNCPICLARGTPIDTPSGEVPVDQLRLGQAVWTLDATGRRVAATVVALGSTIAPPTHRVIRLTLADGRAVVASPGHPLADGRTIGSLQVGDAVDGSVVASLTWLPYGLARTYDLVVSGPTGVYLSDGIALGSTLR